MCNKAACVRGSQKPRKFAIDGGGAEGVNSIISSQFFGFVCFQEFKMGEKGVNKNKRKGKKIEKIKKMMMIALFHCVAECRSTIILDIGFRLFLTALLLNAFYFILLP